MTVTGLRRTGFVSAIAMATVLAMPKAALAASDDSGADGEIAPTEATSQDAPTETVGEVAATETNDDDDDDARTGVLDTGHAKASAGVRGLGAWIDRFFAEEGYEAELNESRLRLRFDGFTEEYEGFDGNATARLYLKLPGLNERVRAKILSDAEELDIDESDADAADQGPPDQENRGLAASLAYFFRNDEIRSISARAGVTFDGYDPDPFLGLRYRELVPLNDDWNFRFVERVRFYSEDRFDSYTAFSLERGLAADRLFRTNLGGTWLEEEENFSYNLDFSLFDPINRKSAIEYQLLNAFTTNPHGLDQVTLRLRYRRQVLREWLILEIAPQLAYRDSRDFEPVPGILFRLDATFGG